MMDNLGYKPDARDQILMLKLKFGLGEGWRRTVTQPRLQSTAVAGVTSSAVSAAPSMSTVAL